MWTDNRIYEEDLQAIYDSCKDILGQLCGKKIFVTGGTGLIGQTVINALLYCRKYSDNSPKIIALVRDIERAKGIFDRQLEEYPGAIEFVKGDVTGDFTEIGDIDYIIHGASQTSSKQFVTNPVETIDVAISGTKNMLELARAKKVAGMVYMSTMEVYGHPKKGEKVSEDYIGTLASTEVRNCYPLSKILCENMCAAYAAEYQVPVSVLRLTQTMGPGIKYDDGRVFAQFARCVIEKQNIVLMTKGETERVYLYVADAVSAVLTALVKGEMGNIYNVANEDTYCSIAQMAEMVAKLGDIQVEYKLQDVTSMGYASTLFMDLDTRKLQGLGWNPTTGLSQMYERMIECMKAE